MIVGFDMGSGSRLEFAVHRFQQIFSWIWPSLRGGGLRFLCGTGAVHQTAHVLTRDLSEVQGGNAAGSKAGRQALGNVVLDAEDVAALKEAPTFTLDALGEGHDPLATAEALQAEIKRLKAEVERVPLLTICWPFSRKRMTGDERER